MTHRAFGIKTSRSVVGGIDQRSGSRGAERNTISHAETSSSPATFLPGPANLAAALGRGPFIHDMREFAAACFAWGFIAAVGFALFVAWFVVSTLIYL